MLSTMDTPEKTEAIVPMDAESPVRSNRRTLIRNILVGAPAVVLASARSAYATGGGSGYGS